MAAAVNREQSEITMDYVNVPDAPARSRSGKGGGETPGRTVIRLVAVSFGLLCILQAALNITLRLTLYNRDIKTSSFKTTCQKVSGETNEMRQLTDQRFQEGWVYLRPSFYYISSDKKSWEDSRNDCQQRGADLVIINTKEEQEFVTKFHKLTWIGLSKRGKNAQWSWVDGTPLTTSYWGDGEPNNLSGKDVECVETRFHEVINSWNDIPCAELNFWICEKNLAE
ncbi:CD209 antigen-like protein E isoform X3 [Parambassis ranga]|uniref:CD209 antigen-like protein E isoform X3 n=1 Tax=Parambassis ranga TaxID=210632 RepID=A0A6P7JB30_9TELE|nr:CD209 antigen-like protein E isoform X3 [Parambassis ranga]